MGRISVKHLPLQSRRHGLSWWVVPAQRRWIDRWMDQASVACFSARLFEWWLAWYVQKMKSRTCDGVAEPGLAAGVDLDLKVVVVQPRGACLYCC